MIRPLIRELWQVSQLLVKLIDIAFNSYLPISIRPINSLGAYCESPGQHYNGQLCEHEHATCGGYVKNCHGRSVNFTLRPSIVRSILAFLNAQGPRVPHLRFFFQFLDRECPIQSCAWSHGVISTTNYLHEPRYHHRNCKDDNFNEREGCCEKRSRLHEYVSHYLQISNPKQFGGNICLRMTC